MIPIFTTVRAGSGIFIRRLELSRNAWRIVAALLGLALVAGLALLWQLVPLKSMEVVTLLVDKATGYVEVARPLEEGGPISEREAVTQANIVRYIRARETYDPPGAARQFRAGLAAICRASEQGFGGRILARKSDQSHETLGRDGTHARLCRERQFPHQWLDAKPGRASDGGRALHDHAHDRARKHHRTLGGQCPVPLHENADEKPMAVR